METHCWTRWLAVPLLFLLVSVVKSSREYKYLELNNGIRVLLVSDPRTTRSAASLDVGVGSWSDPEKVPGLAHFLEHMLFLGTKKYPVEGQYRRFLTKHGGVENAYTIYENTNFYFSASGDFEVFDEATDRFAQFFIAPTLNANAGQREMLAVDSEFRKRINNDYLRFRQVLMTMANHQHPYHRFTTGTIDSLNISGIHSLLVDFHKKYYSSNLMTLCLLGSQSLERLEGMVRRRFEGIPNLNIKRPNFNSPAAFPVPDFTGIKVLMEPLGTINSVYMYWPLPSLDHKQREDPVYYIGWLLGHEGAGSILSTLKSRQWATSILAGPGLQTTSHWLMQVAVTLTDSGLANLNEVMSLIFEYIRLIEREGVQQRIYEEQHRLTLLNYLYQPKARPDLFVKTISRNMQVISNPKDFRVPPTRSRYDPRLIRSILSLLTPQRLLLFVASPHYKQAESDFPNPLNIAKPNLDKAEYWYKTKYRRDKIPSSVLSSLETAPISVELRIPSKNPFVPGPLTVLPRPMCTPFNRVVTFISVVLKKRESRRHSGCYPFSSYRCRCSFKYPERLVSGHGYDLWWKRELNYRTPKLYLNVLLGNPLSATTVEQAAASLLFRHLMMSYLNDKIYAAKLAGFSISVTTPVGGIYIKLKGYSDKRAFGRLLDTVLDALTKYEERTKNETWFDSSRLRTSEGIAGFGPTEQVFKHVKSVYENRIMQKSFFDRHALAAAMLKLSPSDIRSHMRAILRQLYVAVFAYGNANQPDAEYFGKKVIVNLSKEGLKKMLHRRAINHQQRLRIPPGSNIAFRVKGPNPSDVNSGVNVMYQIGAACGSNGDCSEEKYCTLDNVINFMMSRALAYYMKASCFEQLRTKEQLGYIVFCYPYESNGIASVHFVIQSAGYEPQYLLERVEAFVVSFTSTLRKKISSHSQWYHGIRLGAAVAASNGHNMKFRNSINWEHIIDGNCKFNRRRSAINGLRYLRRRPQAMMDFYEQFFLNKRTRRMLAIQLYGKGREVSTVAAEGQTIVTEENVDHFKANGEFYPPETD